MTTKRRVFHVEIWGQPGQYLQLHDVRGYNLDKWMDLLAESECDFTITSQLREES